MKILARVFALTVCIAAMLLGLDNSSTRTIPAPAAAKVAQTQNDKSQSDLSPMLKAEGGKVIPLKGPEMGLPQNALPGAKFITYKQWAQMKEIPKTGLYLVNITYIPRELPERLKEEGYDLKPDGTLLDKDGSPIALFTRTEYFQLQPDKKTGRQTMGGSNEQGVSGFAPFLVNGFLGAGRPGTPHDFRCFSASPWAVYHGGFCRNYEAKTFADAFGFDDSGHCSRLSPHTRIEYIETRAEIGVHRDRDSCRDCDRQSSRAEWDIGCFWPAHGGASGWHYAHLTDLGIRVTRAWSWTD